jgi:hypothetical protein
MKTIPALLVVFGFSIMLLSTACNSEDETNPVSAPTSKFVGRWKSEEPILVKIKTDFCTNVLEDVATMEWNVQWIVTATEDPNLMDITMTYSGSNYTIINSECNSGTGYIPEPQPLYLKGYVDNNNLSIEYLNEEIINVDLVDKKMTGEFSYSYCLVYCQELYTDESSFNITWY